MQQIPRSVNHALSSCSELPTEVPLSWRLSAPLWLSSLLWNSFWWCPNRQSMRLRIIVEYYHPLKLGTTWSVQGKLPTMANYKHLSATSGVLPGNPCCPPFFFWFFPRLLKTAVTLSPCLTRFLWPPIIRENASVGIFFLLCTHWIFLPVICWWWYTSKYVLLSLKLILACTTPFFASILLCFYPALLAFHPRPASLESARPGMAYYWSRTTVLW